MDGPLTDRQAEMRERMAAKRAPKAAAHKEPQKAPKKAALQASPEFHTPQHVEREQAAIDDRLAAKYAAAGIETSEIVVRKNELHSELNAIQQQECEEVLIPAQVANLRRELVSLETKFALDAQRCEQDGLSAEEKAELDRLSEEASATFRSMSKSLDEAGKKLDIMSGKGYKHFGPHGFASMGWGHGEGNDRCLQCGHTLRHRIHVGPSVRWWKQPDGSYGVVRPEGGDDPGIWVVLGIIFAALVIMGVVALVMYGRSTDATSAPVSNRVTPAPAPAAMERKPHVTTREGTKHGNDVVRCNAMKAKYFETKIVPTIADAQFCHSVNGTDHVFFSNVIDNTLSVYDLPKSVAPTRQR